MVRPTLLVAEPEPEQALSARKLVLESGKFNVIAAHSVGEAVELFEQFPRGSAALIHTDLHAANEAITAVKRSRPELPIIAISPSEHRRTPGVDHSVSSHDPQALLNLVRSIFGDPRNIEAQQF
jgi:hypothetical protein